ncbi:MAG: hypothetical protein KDD62_14830 [Bdellovibrionales bacterium]|nr:hypothetical protein [Bdellovibrionales bacterium]
MRFLTLFVFGLVFLSQHNYLFAEENYDCFRDCRAAGGSDIYCEAHCAELPRCIENSRGLSQNACVVLCEFYCDYYRFSGDYRDQCHARVRRDCGPSEEQIYRDVTQCIFDAGDYANAEACEQACQPKCSLLPTDAERQECTRIVARHCEEEYGEDDDDNSGDTPEGPWKNPLDIIFKGQPPLPPPPTDENPLDRAERLRRGR